MMQGFILLVTMVKLLLRFTAEDGMTCQLWMDTSLPPWLPPEGHVCLDSSRPAEVHGTPAGRICEDS